VLISPYPDREGNKLQRQKILMFIYPIYNHNWRNISTIYIYIYIRRLASKEIFSSSNKIHRKVGRAKGLSTPPVLSTSRPHTKHQILQSSIEGSYAKPPPIHVEIYIDCRSMCTVLYKLVHNICIYRSDFPCAVSSKDRTLSYFNIR